MSGPKTQKSEAENLRAMPTIRQQIFELLAREAASAREISQEVGISEKEVPGHLNHLAKTARQMGKRLELLPFACLDCGFVFQKRSRFTDARGAMLNRPGS